MPSPRVIAVSTVPALLAMASACKVESDYGLVLQPRVPLNQDVFGGTPALKVLLRQIDDAQLHFVDDASVGSPSIGAMPPLTAAHVGLVIEESGGPRQQLNPTLLRAYGEVGPLDLGRERQETERPVLVSAFGRVGELGRLDEPRRYGAAVLTESGDVWILGGTPGVGNSSGDGTDTVLQLSDLDAGDWSFEEVASLPLPLSDLAATTVTVDGTEYVVAAGGRPDWSTTSDNQSTLLIWRADTGEELFRSGPLDGLAFSRSAHVMVPLVNGRVLVAGGLTGNGQVSPNAGYELIDAIQAASVRQSGWDAPVEPLGLAATPIGEDGALLCGGMRYEPRAGSGYDEVPSARCAIIGLDGANSPAASLPTAVSLPAMTTLTDGRVLLTGGIPETVTRTDSALGSGAASALGWIYDPRFDAWSPTGGLEHPRAGHRMVATPDGGAVVFGGTTHGGVLYQQLGEPVQCTEVWTPEEETWRTLEPCTAVGGGAFPIYAVNPRHGAFVLTGGDARDDGGQTFGVVSLGPWLAPGQEL